MLRWFSPVVACAALAAGCSGSTPTTPDRPPTLSRTRFLAFGDSITAGEVTAPVGDGLPGGGGIHKLIVLPTASYPSVLQGQLSSRYATQTANIAVVNAGLPGESVLNGAVRFSDTFNANRPDVVLLMEGVNGLPFVGPDNSTEAIRAMAQTAKSRGARVFVGSMVPTITGRQRSADPVYLVVYNDLLRAMAAQEGLVYVDLYNTLMPEVSTLIGIDGLHPTEAGYRRVAELFFNAIRNDLEVR
jgi:lysophospholipase L1-like esterase